MNIKERFGRIARRCLALLAASVLPLSVMAMTGERASAAEEGPELQVAAVSASSMSLKLANIGDAHTVHARITVALADKDGDNSLSDPVVEFSNIKNATFKQAVPTVSESGDAVTVDVIVSGGDKQIADKGPVNIGTLSFSGTASGTKVRVSVDALQVTNGSYDFNVKLPQNDAGLPAAKEIRLTDRASGDTSGGSSSGSSGDSSDGSGDGSSDGSSDGSNDGSNGDGSGNGSSDGTNNGGTSDGGASGDSAGGTNGGPGSGSSGSASGNDSNGGSAGGGASGQGAGSASENNGASGSAAGSASGVAGVLSNTGVAVGGAVIIFVALAAAGIILLEVRRRRSLR